MHNIRSSILSSRTWKLLKFDLLRLQARLRSRRARKTPAQSRLHFGCGTRHIAGWLNVDVTNSQQDVDLSGHKLPWDNQVFEAIVGQQVVEHLELSHELLPMLREMHRVARPGAEIWLSCPDMEKACRSYIEHKGADMVTDRKQRWPNFSLSNIPSQQVINVLFHQGGEHKNLYDFELLQWALKQTGWGECRRTCEADFRARFPEFPARNDDYSSLYVQSHRI